MSTSENDVHVLAVDDSSVDRAVIAHLLRSKKFRVTTVDSGRRALEMLNMEPNVNMIITDYSMPEMTCYELLKEIKGSSRLKEIPVVIMSSENISVNINRCLEEGADDFLLKPVRMTCFSELYNIDVDDFRDPLDKQKTLLLRAIPGLNELGKALLARLLGFRQLVPAYANARRTEVLRGFNFASGAAGIRAETGNNLGQHYHFEEQVDHFEEALRFMARMFRGNRTAVAEHLSKVEFHIH